MNIEHICAGGGVLPENAYHLVFLTYYRGDANLVSSVIVADEEDPGPCCEKFAGPSARLCPGTWSMCIHETLCRTFENRVSVYLEKDIILCRISNIRANLDRRIISADIEEIPTIGLGVGIYPTRGEQGLQRPKAMCWKIGAGFMTTFSQDHWPNEVNDSISRYHLMLEWLQSQDEHLGYRERRSVFQDE